VRGLHRVEDRRDRSGKCCKPEKTPGFHFRFKGLQDIDSGLQTGFMQAFSDSGLTAIAFSGFRMVSAIVLPEGWIIEQTISVIGEDEVAIFSFPAFLDFVFLTTLAVVAGASDLSIAESGMWIE
jgi:hypothetical protein